MEIKCNTIKEIRTLFNRFWTKLGQKVGYAFLLFFISVIAIVLFGGLFFYFTEVPVVAPQSAVGKR